MTGLYTIPPDKCFVTALAQGLWEQAEGDPMKLSAMRVYLPTRRSCRHLQDAFLRVAQARATLLPRLYPLGDVEEDGPEWLEATADIDIPPAISSLRRQLLLLELVRKKEAAPPYDQALSLATALAGLLDQAQTEGASLEDLRKIVPQNYAEHWQETLRFLEIILESWPKILSEGGWIDPVQRRTLVLDKQIRLWREAPPSHPVIIAGSTGSHPVVGRFMAMVARLPSGTVVLPGLDIGLDEDSWQVLGETHPQYTMRHWLETSDFKRNDVSPWPAKPQMEPARVAMLREALRPAETTDRWGALSQDTLPAEAFKGFEMIALEHHREEADVIALKLRSVLEEKGKTAALVTPDRALAGRVAANLGRWAIEINDSAGTPLRQWPVGSYLSLLLRAARPGASPVDLLAFFKHPLTACGVSAGLCRAYARQIEKAVWRGIRPNEPLLAAIKHFSEADSKLAAWAHTVHQRLLQIGKVWTQSLHQEDWIKTHLEVAEALAQTDQTNGDERLWRGDDGQAAALWIAEWREACENLAPLTGDMYAALFESLIKCVDVRPSFGQHPRLSLLGPLEARLLQHDVVILGGLNEDIWPPAPPVDPWLSRPMKREFGLPSPERRTGLSAHDFAQLACAPQVLITRAKRVKGALTVPSRFWLQLEAVLQASGYDVSHLAPKQPLRQWSRALDWPKRFISIDKPQPKPPVSVRPTSLRVTEIGTWRRNPYALYAKHILRLEKLDPLDADVSAADLGSLVHDVLEKFIKESTSAAPRDWLSLLLKEGRDAFSLYANRPQMEAFWWPRFEKMAHWFVEQEKMRRAAGLRPIGVERPGTMALAGGVFSLRGRADRIDLSPDGGMTIIDYKTGTAPSVGDVLSGYEPQLALLAMMAEAGSFEIGEKAQVASLEYWALFAREDKDKIRVADKDLGGQIACARRGLEDLVQLFSDPKTPYQAEPKPDRKARYNDYAHLSRIAEWGDRK